jgi:hypothetical protein
VHAEVVPCKSVVGGGTSPGLSLPSFAVALAIPDAGANLLAAKLRAMRADDAFVHPGALEKLYVEMRSHRGESLTWAASRA